MTLIRLVGLGLSPQRVYLEVAMHILHGTWIAGPSRSFDNPGRFVLWVETDQPVRLSRAKATEVPPHPQHLSKAALASFLTQTLPKPLQAEVNATNACFTLPSHGDAPLPCWELSLGQEPPKTYNWRQWAVDGIQVRQPMRVLKELHLLASRAANGYQLGRDLLFWYHYSRAFREVVIKHQYIPALRCQSTQAKRRKTRASGKHNGTLSFHPTWDPLSSRYEQMIDAYAQAMPWFCAGGSTTPATHPAEFCERAGLLRHFSESILTLLVEQTRFPQKQLKSVAGTFIEGGLLQHSAGNAITQETWGQWQSWKQRLGGSRGDAGSCLGFRLHSASEQAPDDWALELLATADKDPSFKLSLADYWQAGKRQRGAYHRVLGGDFEQHLVLSLGHAARIYPRLWQGLETDQPAEVRLTMDQAFAFLKDSAWVLQDAGYPVAVPAWWTPQGRRRAQLRLKTSVSSAPSKSGGKGYFDLPNLVDYRYELAIGGHPVSEAEWRALVKAKTPLVQFRGEWIELEQDKMAKMLALWRDQGKTSQQMPLADMIKQAADGGEDLVFDYDATLAKLLEGLFDPSRLTPVATPKAFCGDLRGYQQRGLSWLFYLERLGMGPCLADDMGLGKTIQVIALLLKEREQAQKPSATLLIAPTSVLGNWQKELARFAPTLKTLLHHGPGRRTDAQRFRHASKAHDVVITSFALARKDARLLQGVAWRRVVVDEAQNIKNPKSAQAKAVVGLEATHRMALTGTPIENRLMDLWSLFRFTNPGYLGTAAQFKKSFETPIQRDADVTRSETLKQVIQPFMLRRMKTDKAIISDLPDKAEQKVYCNLSQEQASLYQAVVDEVQETLEATEGIQRKGLILATLMKLKQICNHPRQFLQDGSAFSESRSHKLARLMQMIEEVIAEGESLLVFSQFTDIGEALQQHLTKEYRHQTFYLHGGTTRTRRDRMITRFQDPDTDPAVFVLSLKAGGVGITLTKANHVFHFDRWWNPAVEDQATDRAFRIGQEKKVMVHKFVTLGTLEERIDQMLEDKKRLADSIVGSGESWLTELDNEAFQRLIALNRSAVL